VNTKVERNYLEINSIRELNDSNNVDERFTIQYLKNTDFQINKFFYKNVGKKHNWVDRLVWTEKKWIDYVSNKNVKTYILKDKNEVEIAYLGLLEEYINKKLGSYLLSSAIKKSFIGGPKRVWVHTCSLDHKNALSNYIARGMKVFKKETITT